MGWLRKIFSRKKEEKRSALSDDRFFSDFLYAAGSKSGVHVTADNAMRLTSVYCAIRILSESVAQLPIIVKQEKRDGSFDRKPDHYVSALMRKPNRWMSSFEFREYMMGHTLLRGNSFAQIIRNGAGEAIELIPLHPDRVTPAMDKVTGEITYKYREDMGAERVFRWHEIFHLRGLSSDGLQGMSPIDLMREAIGLGIAAEEFGARFFSNDSRPGGVLQHPGELDDAAYGRIKKSWKEAHSGLAKSHEIAILEDGMEWKQIGLNNEQAQFILTRKFQIEEVARAFRIPLHMLSSLENATFSNIEQQSLEFVRDTLLPWVIRWEETVERDILLLESDADIRVKLLVQGLLRGEFEARNKGYAIARQNGWMSANDIRRLEDMNPLPPEIGDVYLVPLNMQNAEALAEVDTEEEDDQQEADQEEEPADEGDEEGQTEGDVQAEEDEGQASILPQDINYRAVHASFDGVFREILGRIVRKQVKELERGKLDVDKHRTFARELLLETVRGNIRLLYFLEGREGDVHARSDRALAEFSSHFDILSEDVEPLLNYLRECIEGANNGEAGN